MKIPCSYWKECANPIGGCCDIDAYNRPSFGVCLRVCEQYDGPARGRGDLLHKLAKTVTLGLVEPCNGCKKRRVNGNAKHPSKRTKEILVGVED